MKLEYKILPINYGVKKKKVQFTATMCGEYIVFLIIVRPFFLPSHKLLKC